MRRYVAVYRLRILRYHVPRLRYNGGEIGGRMAEKKLMKGNEAIAEAAIRGGCRFYAGYPITPQNEIPEYMSWRLNEVGGRFVQAESEIAAINMVYGSAGAGGRYLLHMRSGASLRYSQYGAFRPRTRRYSARSVRLLPGGQGWRTRRLPYARIRSQLSSGVRQFDVRRL